MKLRWILISTVAATLAAAVMFAQAPAPGPGGRGPRPGRALKQGPGPLGPLDGPLGLGGPNAERRLTRALNLDASQQNQVHTALQEEQVLMQGLPEKGADLRTQLTTAIRAGDDSRIDQIARDLSQLTQQETAIRAKSVAKIYRVLNAEQKADVDRLLNRGLRGRGRGPGAAPGVVR